ncbi:ABC transporter permease [Acidipropionibacterium jensenii]|uniref:Oligopeptide transport system permease protein OppC n=1 Tax=Acidipropionibacterium jensenii TaxID=1749 RepID=A0A3S4USA2_9ACTN|nr:ABC transporter permease [Acidipropionibacterium jensenii]AZZ38910.1 ABC transporter permease [Acidipropionibacterium jensenii]AZZ42721.1 ABC transporter permease [Acidipropionibacterium jensenii]MDN5978166.1 ABC transporter permease [Acidipropionibacterium jensenii]MDN5995233.1 ABC transporter permease [Acidipropionibacterium jensenii]MDN6021384.1 ABC transporter permease [Acidipropionibacterium jensenii]
MVEPNFSSGRAADRPEGAVDSAPLTEPVLDPGQEPQGRKGAKHLSRGRLIWRRFWRAPGGKIGLIGLSLVLALALFGTFFERWDYWVVDYDAFLSAPSASHWFGTNQGGFDIFAMTIEGLRKSLIIGFAVAAIVEILAAMIGASAAYFGKRVGAILQWITDLLLVIPSFLIIAIISQHTAGSKNSTWLLIVLLSAFSWMISARVVRAMTLSLVNLDYVTAAKFMSVPSFVVIVKHVIPNVASYLIIDFTLGVVSAVFSETTLSFFGFGVQKPETSLGTLLGDGMASATTSPWIFLFPAGILVVLLLCVNFMGDALRDAIDPSSKSGGAA